MEPSGDSDGSRTVFLTFDVIMKMEDAFNDMVSALDSVDGVSELKVIASRTDVDY